MLSHIVEEYDGVLTNNVVVTYLNVFVVYTFDSIPLNEVHVLWIKLNFSYYITM